jgi:polyferredoxin
MMHEAMHGIMPGLPSGYATLTIAISTILLCCAIVFPRKVDELTGRFQSTRFNLLSISVFHRFARNRSFQLFLQIFPVALLILIIATGLFGIQNSLNFAPVTTWTIWWALLIFDIILFGRSWCLVCPWYAIATWIKRLAFIQRTREPFNLNLPWPESLKNIYLAVGLFLLLTWLELGFDVTSNPQITALLALLMTAMIVVPSVVYEKMSFCHYGCLVGRICGLYSVMAPVEIRAKDKNICNKCQEKACRHGSENGYPCPTDLDLSELTSNNYCLNCTECIKSCPYDNVACNIRPFGSELHSTFKPKKDEASLAIVLLAMTSFHGITMTPSWTTYLDWSRSAWSVSHLVAFTIGMGLFLMFFGALYILFSRAFSLYEDKSQLAGAGTHYAYTLIPLALFYHLAHNGAHFIREGKAILIAASDPFGWGWNLLGYKGTVVTPMTSHHFLWSAQVFLALVGFYFALKMCVRIASQRSEQSQPQRFSVAFVSSLCFLFHSFNVWLLAQPMIMRTGM